MKRLFVFVAALLMAAVMMTAQDGARKYGVKSGTAKVETEMMGQKVEITSWFDDYGALEATLTKMGGMEATTISKDGKSWMVNPAMKMVQEVPAQQEQVNFMNLTDEIIAKYKIMEIGKETVAGKDCVQYSLEVEQMGQTVKMKVSVWKGYSMKSVSSVMGMDIAATVTEFTECDVDPSHFEIPVF